MTIQEYEAELKSHDRYYQMSDDMKAWDKGNKNEKRLADIAKENGQEFIDLFIKYTQY